MIVIRIVLKKYAKELFAPGVPGRWNGEGKKVIYTAGSVALATMENMIYRKGYGFNNNYAVMLIELPDKLSITAYSAADLPRDWNDPGSYAVSQPVGNRWYDSMETSVLKVPSAVVPQEYNYVLHSLHPEFSRIKLIAVTEYVPDPRIDDILKKYPH